MRKALVVALTAVVVGVPAVTARAAMADCPAGVSDVTGTNPTLAQVAAWIETSAATHHVPASVLRVIAYKESTWRQYDSTGHVLVSSDGACSLGLMQVTVGSRTDGVRLANDPAYNVDEGAKILAAKYAGAQGTPPADTGEGDDPDVIENWYYSLCLYNGCTNDPALYADPAAHLLSDPFRYLPDGAASFRALMPPAGFTRPQDADPSYTLPNAFQARHDADKLVFYNGSTGVVTSTVDIATHLVSAPPVVSYPERTWGPDGSRVTCTACIWWRLAEGVGRSGRAHWTNSVTGPEGVRVNWLVDASQGEGRYRLEAYVPAIGAETLGTATYTVVGEPSRTVDQNAVKNQWVGLAETSFSSGDHLVWVGDHSTVGGQKIVADAMRLLPVPTVRLTTENGTSSAAHTYGDRGRLDVALTDVNGTHLAGRSIVVYARPLGTTTWKGVGVWKTNSGGDLSLAVTPGVSTEYTARFVPSATDAHARAASNNARVTVAHRVSASISTSSLHPGQYATVSGSVAPGHAGRTVYLQRLVGTSWRNVLSRPLSSASTVAFRFTMSVDHTQTVYFRIYAPADPQHTAGYSQRVGLVAYRS